MSLRLIKNVIHIKQKKPKMKFHFGLFFVEQFRESYFIITTFSVDLVLSLDLTEA